MKDSSLAASSNLAQIGSVEDDSHLIIHLINTYTDAATFIEWISDNNYTRKVVHVQNADSKYTRISLYYMEGLLALALRVELDFTVISEKLSQFLLKTQDSGPIKVPDDIKVVRQPMRRVVTDPQYSVVGQLFEEERMIGIMWEVYELPELCKAYAQRQDPLRYWKMDRRE